MSENGNETFFETADDIERPFASDSEAEYIEPVVIGRRDEQSPRETPFTVIRMFSVLVSHGDAERDTAVAQRVATALSQRGLSVSMGSDAIDTMGLDGRPSVFVAVLSTLFEATLTLREDLLYAHSASIPIAALIIDQSELLTWSVILADRNTVSASDCVGGVAEDGSQWGARLSSFVDKVAALVSRSPDSPPSSVIASQSMVPDAKSRPNSGIFSVQRKPRLSILRPRSSIWNITQAPDVSATNSLARREKLRGLSLLKKYLHPSDISSPESLEVRYARLDATTRSWLINNIAKWVKQSDAEDDTVLWLLGGSGAGKSTAAAALIKHLPQKAGNTHVAWALLSPNLYADTGDIINSLVYRLAESWSDFAKELTDLERKQKPLGFQKTVSSTIPQRLRTLISDPILMALSKVPLSTAPSILFIIDGLEHFENESALNEFILTLKCELQILPPNVKFLFLSEPTDSINQAMSGLNPTHIELEGAYQLKDLKKVHQRLITQSLIANCKYEPEDLDEAVRALTLQCNNSFLYSRFAFEPIRISGIKFKSPHFIHQAIQIFPHNVNALLLGLLTYLYDEETADIDDPQKLDEELSLFRKVFATLMFMKARVSVKCLSGFIEQPEQQVRTLLARNCALLDIVLMDVNGVNTAHVQLAHACVAEFIASEQCADARFRIMRRAAHAEFALRLLKHATLGLRANPLKLEDPSTWLNEEIPDLEKSLSERVPEHVLYVVKYLGIHFESLAPALQGDGGGQVGRKTVKAVQTLVGVFVSDKLLEWMETLSLLGLLEEVGQKTLRTLLDFITSFKASTRLGAIAGFFARNAVTVARVASKQLLGSSSSASLIDDSSTSPDTSTVPGFIETILPNSPPPTTQTIHLLRDAIHFLTQFQAPIATSSFHVYISAIPFSPPTSLIHKHYRKSADRAAFSSQGTSRRVPIVMRGVCETWPDLVHVIYSHSRLVSAVCVSPDGRWIASASYDCTVRIFEAETGRLYRILEGHTDQVWNLSISSDSAFIVSGGHDETAKTWILQTGECVKTTHAKTFGINRLAITRDGSKLISIQTSDGSVLVRWNVQHETEGKDADSEGVLWKFVGHQGAVGCVAVTVDGNMVASGGIDDCTVRLWDLVSGKGIRTLDGHGIGGVQCVTFSGDGKVLVSGGADETCRVWDVQSGRCLKIFTGHEGCINSVAITSDGRRLVSGSDDQTVRVWELKLDNPTSSSLDMSMSSSRTAHSPSLNSNPYAKTIEAIKITSAGDAVISAGVDDLIHVWHAETGALLRSFEYSILGVSSKREAVHKIARMEGATGVEEFEYSVPEGGFVTSGAVKRLVTVPGGVQVSSDRIEIKKRRNSAGSINSTRDSLAIVKVDGRVLMLTKTEVEHIEAQMDAIERGLVDVDFNSVTSPVSDVFSDDGWSEAWYMSADGWVFDKRDEGVRRFWLPETYRGEITMDVVSLRLMTRYAALSKQWVQTHSQLLSTLLSLENVNQQLGHATSHAASHSHATTHTPQSSPHAFDEDHILRQAAPLLVKALNSKQHSILSSALKLSKSLEKDCAAIKALKRDAIATLNSDSAFNAWTNSDTDASAPALLDVARWIDNLSGMYERETIVLCFLMEELRLLPPGFEPENEHGCVVLIEHVVARFRSMHEVDLVFEADVMEIARAAAAVFA
ncbi:hypothetical protein HDU77_006938 [Chytriomyces hyalinus]|nr:hypothetical protein HDU77_006938 [Chytriomyces hyalinus]